MPNQLIHETSPYLLQHAHNPVNWHPWGAAALAKAEKENKPILVSIGYSTCHWCHVMERESFENEEVAAFMNEHFINIKVDREERPDIDGIYMEAIQVLTGAGGWPLNCFLTPDRRPFYGGTYFPPVSRHRLPSWEHVLQSIANAFKNKRDTVEEQANKLTEHIQKSDSALLDKIVGAQLESDNNFNFLQDLYYKLRERFDRLEGGFGGAPKFPGAMSLSFLFKYYTHTHNKEALEHAEFSLEKMIRGGIYDQLGGGFARYATDRAWLVPHFEKMLYDNALLISALSDAYKITGKALYKTTIEETLTYVQREMTTPEGGFYAAQDADSEGVEGKFFVWDKSEIDELLGEDTEIFCKFYGVSEAGNWEHKNILWRPESLEDFVKQNKLDTVQLKQLLASSKNKLFQYRDKRIKPGLDDKVLLDWNALMCSAFAKAFEATQNERYREIAVQNISFMLEKFRQEPDSKKLYHTYKNGTAKYEAFLNDYAFLIEALLDVYEITFDPKYIKEADQFIAYVLEKFFDSAHQLFYFTTENQSDVIVRQKHLYDNATPSGNSTMVRNLQRLALILDKEAYHNIVTKMLTRLRDAIALYPGSFSRWAECIMASVYPYKEIAVIGKDAKKLATEINKQFVSHKVIMATEKPDDTFPLLFGKDADDGETLVYICQNYACQAPVSSLEEVEKMLKNG